MAGLPAGPKPKLFAKLSPGDGAVVSSAPAIVWDESNGDRWVATPLRRQPFLGDPATAGPLVPGGPALIHSKLRVDEHGNTSAPTPTTSSRQFENGSVAPESSAHSVWAALPST